MEVNVGTIFAPKSELSIQQLDIIKLAVKRYFIHSNVDGLHGRNIFRRCILVSDFCNVLGLTYSSSGSYAALWACSEYVFFDDNKTFRFAGFGMDSRGTVFAILKNKDDSVVLKYSIKQKANEIDFCYTLVLSLMETTEFGNDYCGALSQVLAWFPNVNKPVLEAQLDKWI